MEGQSSTVAGLKEPGRSSSRSERRQTQRYAVDCPATLALLSGAGTIKGRLADLSLGGCRMITPEPVSLGVLARVEVSFELRGCTFRMIGVTAGTRAKRSFGLRFLEMPQRRAQALVELLGEIATDPEEPQAPAQEAVTPPMEQAAAEIRAAELAQAVSSPSQTKAPAEPVAAAQSCAGTAAPATPAAAGAGERRQHARHGVDTRVNLTLIRGAITMPGCILNLSQGGCRLRTDEHFNVGIYTRVEAEFYLHGLPFRLAGVSQAILDKNTIGIRFLDMSERKRAQLTELIAEIEEMQGQRDQGPGTES